MNIYLSYTYVCICPLQKEDHISWNSGSYKNSLKAKKKERKIKEGREGEKSKRKRNICYCQ